MKAITLYEPYASLMRLGAKRNETRRVRTKYRGDICIHAAKAVHEFLDPNLRAATTKAFESRGQRPTMNSFGCIVAIVEIFDVVPSDMFFRGSLFNRDQHAELMKGGMIPLFDEEYTFGNYAPGRFIYRTRRLRRLKNPVPTRGYQSIGWTVPPDIEARVLAELCPHDTDGDGNCPLHPKGCFK